MAAEMTPRRAKPGPALSTQERNPLSTALRSGVQALAGLVPVVLFAAPILRGWLEEHHDAVPPGLYGWLTGAVAAAVAVSTLASRLMAVPAVNAWLRRWIPALAPEDYPHT